MAAVAGEDSRKTGGTIGGRSEGSSAGIVSLKADFLLILRRDVEGGCGTDGGTGCGGLGVTLRRGREERLSGVTVSSGTTRRV